MPGETLLKSPETARLPSFSCPLGGQASGHCKTVPQPFLPPYANRMARLGQSMPNFSYANAQGDGRPIAPKSQENCKKCSRCRVFSGHLAGCGRVSHSFTDYPNVSAVRTTGVLTEAPACGGDAVIADKASAFPARRAMLPKRRAAADLCPCSSTSRHSVHRMNPARLL